MAKYKSYIHVERLGRAETEGILDGICYVFPKIDGTNAVVFCDDNGVPQCGSRSRMLTKTKDNAGFYSWVNGFEPEADCLRAFVRAHPNLIIYGEFGLNRVGKIKYYDPYATNHMWIFDMWDTNDNRYLTYEEIMETIEGWEELENYIVPCLAKLGNPTEEELIKIAKEQRYLIPKGLDKVGEGIVIKNYQFRDKWGNYQVGKIVLDEWKQNNAPKERKPQENLEEEIVEKYLTDAELGKAVAKVLNLLEMDEIDLKNGQFIGRTISLVWKDFVEENVMDMLKKFKNPIIDFSKLKSVCDTKTKQYIGLI